MTVIIIGIATVTALVWVVAASLANESDVRRRLDARDNQSGGGEEKRRVVYDESQRAA
ncbi:hypothetical protein [Nitrospira sp. KM1]|uniref:hypothetical protein n=1 Tax=Nitrospira sp. KM1 TaxID=1936990 RepID=UPI001564E484|nr:hypothetical protein [Nitrospira sp. KM1]